MSNNLSALMSATFYERGYDHHVEIIHQRDAGAHRRLESLEVTLYDAGGTRLATPKVDPAQDILDLRALVTDTTGTTERIMVVLDARYDEAIFPYRPHHYAYLHRTGSTAPPLYYAINAVLGGVPDRVGATNINNFETYVFRQGPFEQRYSLLLGCLARFVPVTAQVFTYYGSRRLAHDVTLGPKCHTEISLAASVSGERLARVEVKALFRLLSYVVGRRADTGDLVLFDHLFTYAK
jgi:hypothetical protein